MYRNLKFLHMTDFFSTGMTRGPVTNIRYVFVRYIWNILFGLCFGTLIWWYLKYLISLSKIFCCAKLGQSVWLNCPIFGLTRLLLVLAVQDQVWREKLNLLREKLNLLQENCPFVSLTKASPDWPSPDQGRSPKCFLNWQVWKLRQVSKTCDTVGTKWVKIFLETWQKKFDKAAICECKYFGNHGR